MSQLWRDGSPLVKELPNGDGYSQSGSYPITHYQYNDWIASPSSSSDKRNVSTTEAIDLAPGNSRCLEFAYIAAHDTTSNDLFASVNKVIAYSKLVQQFYDNQTDHCPVAIVALEETKVTKQIKVYPNPATTILYIQSLEPDDIQKISVTSVSGTKVLELGENMHQISIDNLSAGVYILNILNKNGKVERCKFIKH